MNHYEGMFIFKQDLSKDNLDKVLSQVQETIAKYKGSLDQPKQWGRQKLAYPIKKYKEGIYYLINFHIDPSSISKLRRYFSLNESILRVLITRI